MKLILNGREGYENKELDKKAELVRKCENGVVIVSEHEKMLKNERSNIIRITSKQCYVLNEFKELKRFVQMVKQLEISKSTINFKINLYKLIRKYPRIENSCLLLFYVKNYLKHMKLTCKTSGNDFKFFFMFIEHGTFSTFMKLFPCSRLSNCFPVHGTFSMLMKVLHVYGSIPWNFFRVYGTISMFMEFFYVYGSISYL